MSAAQIKPTGQSSKASAGDMLSVFALYDDPAACAQVVAVGRQVAAKFAPDLKFRFLWWRADFVTDSALGNRAVSEAAQADILIVACGRGGGFSFSLLNWFEEVIARRERETGALLDMTQTGSTSSGTALHVKYYFQDIAQRAGLDYLSRPLLMTSGNPAYAVSFPIFRAVTLASCFKSTGFETPPPSHHGLNE